MKTIELSFVSSAIHKKHRAEIKVQGTPFGDFEYICIEKLLVPDSELIRLAEKHNLPIFYKDKKIFPKGKSMRDIINEQNAKKGSSDQQQGNSEKTQ